MKKFAPPILVTIFFLVTVFSGCGGGKNPGGTTYTPGQSSITYNFVNSEGITASFQMNYAPSGSFASDVRFLNDPTFLYTSISVPNGYWIAQTDVMENSIRLGDPKRYKQILFCPSRCNGW
jgi:hypothetical protein